MSLIHWWPLNGNCDDYGSNKIILENTKVSFNSNGKIGQAAFFNDDTAHLKATDLFYLHNLKKYTFSCWVYLTAPASNHSSSFLSSGNWNATKSQLCFAVYDFNSSKNAYTRLLYPNNNQGWSSSIILTENNYIKLNQWYHILITYNGYNTKAFINGSYVGEQPYGGISLTESPYYYLGAATYYSGFSMKGNLNDFRIYDYDLSLKEIKELYKTKVLHFNFNDPREEYFNNIWDQNLRFSGMGHDLSYSFIGEDLEGWQKYSVDGTGTGDTYPYTFNVNPLGTIYKNKPKSTSFLFKSNCIHKYNNFGTAYMVNIAYQQEFKKTIKKISPNTYLIKFENIKPKDYDTSFQPIYFTSAVNKGVVFNPEIDYVAFKEIITVEAPQVPKTFSTNKRHLKVADSSGYRNYGDFNELKPISWTEDSSLGRGAFKFNGNNVITHPNPFLGQDNLKQEWSVCAWVKIDANSPTGAKLNDFNLGNRLIHGSTPLLYLNSGSHDYYTYGQLLPKDEWIHVAFVFRNLDGLRKIYLNGENISTGGPNHDNTPSGIPDIVSIGYNFKGDIADYRIYATALNEKDIKELYESKASISKNGKIFINEINEQKNLFDTKIILQRQEEMQRNHNTKYIIEDNRQCMAFSASSFYIKDGFCSIFTKDYFKEKTSYFFKITIKSNLIYQNNEVPAGFTIYYDDGTSNRTFNVKTHNQWETYYTITDPAKTISEVDVYYHIGDLFYVDLKNTCIIENINYSITKQSQLFCNEINELDSLSFQIKNFDNADWVRLFYHNCKDGTVLFNSNKSEFLKCNTGDKVSDLWALEQFRGQDGKFEFLLQYPSEISKYNRWKQSSNFTKEKVSGYEAVHIDWSSQYWGGLEYNGGSTWADGSANHGNWYYAIGCKSKYGSGMPNFNDSTNGAVELWVRCDKPEVLKFYKNRAIQATEFIEN